MSVSSPTPTIAALQSCRSLSDFARLIEIEPKELSYVLYKIEDSDKYHEFFILKKDGSPRTISAPIPKLRFIQARTLNLFHDAARERDLVRGSTQRFSHGSKKGTGIVSNADRHVRKRFLLNLDLKDFFPSIHIGRIIGFLTKDKYLLLDNKVATVIAQICTHQGLLPQGAPTSPLFANFLAEILDRRLIDLCKSTGSKYSRYIDDITISTSKINLSDRIGEMVDGKFQVSDEIKKIIIKAGFFINTEKTRLSTNKQRQSVTGLTVNKHPNVLQNYSRTTRAMCNQILWGRKAFVRQLWDQADAPVTLRQIEGRLGFEASIRSHSLDRSITQKQDEPTKFEKLHRDFLLYKHLIAGRGPAFICEGESDRIYIDLMIRRLRSESNRYFSSAEDGHQRRYEIPGNSDTFHELTSLGGGTSNLNNGLIQISKFLKKYKYPEPRWPTIIVIDSDKAGMNLATSVGKWFGVEFNPVTNANVFALRLGLYIVFIPVPAGKKTAVIETLIPKHIKGEKNGKTFSVDNKYDAAKFYGKAILAKSLRSDPSLDVSFFEPLMLNIEWTVEMFEADLIASG